MGGPDTGGLNLYQIPTTQTTNVNIYTTADICEEVNTYVLGAHVLLQEKELASKMRREKRAAMSSEV